MRNLSPSQNFWFYMDDKITKKKKTIKIKLKESIIRVLFQEIGHRYIEKSVCLMLDSCKTVNAVREESEKYSPDQLTCDHIKIYVTRLSYRKFIIIYYICNSLF